jgi:hypothetical protein
MYPLGESVKGVLDMSGNVWEWQANYSAKEKRYLGLRGGSWNNNEDDARVSIRNNNHPNNRNNNIGFRVVAFHSFVASSMFRPRSGIAAELAGLLPGYAIDCIAKYRKLLPVPVAVR